MPKSYLAKCPTVGIRALKSLPVLLVAPFADGIYATHNLSTISNHFRAQLFKSTEEKQLLLSNCYFHKLAIFWKRQTHSNFIWRH